ncbi:MAG TPA: 50S ribosomal protein L35 [Candidatus Paceibacterota bacterium]|nr:50S ribosomal protein L35 [Candidatus Paceibacterota bacterium]
MKTNKSYTKRIKVTRNGVLVARKPGQDHFNAKERGRTKGVKRRANLITVPKRIIRQFLSKTSA